MTDSAATSIRPDLPWQTTYKALLGAVKVGTSKSVKHIQGVDGMTVGELKSEIEKGGRFVVYLWDVSLLVITLRRVSPIRFMRTGENRVLKGLPWAFLSFVAGWWGIPWGFIYTPVCIVTDLKGGRDVTAAIAQPLIAYSLAATIDAGSPAADQTASTP